MDPCETKRGMHCFVMIPCEGQFGGTTVVSDHESENRNIMSMTKCNKFDVHEHN